MNVEKFGRNFFSLSPGKVVDIQKTLVRYFHTGNSVNVVARLAETDNVVAH
jgi:hypothetical protein